MNTGLNVAASVFLLYGQAAFLVLPSHFLSKVQASGKLSEVHAARDAGTEVVPGGPGK